jgi:hypothetical protein
VPFDGEMGGQKSAIDLMFLIYPMLQTKASQTVRFDIDVLAAFKSTGKGWQTRMNEALIGPFHKYYDDGPFLANKRQTGMCEMQNVEQGISNRRSEAYSRCF